MGAERVSTEALIERLDGLPSARRSIVAIAGPPAAGKSTLVARLEAALNARAPGRAATLPMDGYHLDDAVLRARGRLARKGAPDTFDVGGLEHMLRRLRANAEAEIAVPIFDREIEVSRAGGRMIPQTAELVLVEGNYLLVDTPPWSDLSALFDLRVMIEVSSEARARRLRERWRMLGLPDDAVDAKVADNDLPNGDYVIERSINADLIVIDQG